MMAALDGITAYMIMSRLPAQQCAVQLENAFIADIVREAMSGNIKDQTSPGQVCYSTISPVPVML